MMAGPADDVIVGAGIIGLSIAHQNLRRSRLTVLALAKGATAEPRSLAVDRAPIHVAVDNALA